MFGHNPNQVTVDLEYEDHTIKGKLVKSSLRMTDMAFHTLKQDEREHIRNALVRELASYMLEHKMVELTSVQTPMGDYLVNARCFVTDNADVKILRTVRIGNR